MGNYLCCTRSESSLLHTSIWYVTNRLRDWVSKYNVCEFLKCKYIFFKYMAVKITKKKSIITQPISISNRHLFRVQNVEKIKSMLIRINWCLCELSKAQKLGLHVFSFFLINFISKWTCSLQIYIRCMYKDFVNILL